MTEDKRARALERLKEPFDPDEIELLPKPYKKDSQKGKCDVCGGYHGLPAVHLSYVGHAGITMRLNEVDPEWLWEPMAYAADGTPFITRDGLWIWLTVLGKRIPAFGDAQGKTGPNAVKEMIGDAIRNGAMRFGVGTYLWSKSDKAKAELTRQGVDDDEVTDVQRGVAGKPTAYDQPATDKPMISEQQMKLIGVLAKERNVSADTLHEKVNGKSRKDLTREEASGLISWLMDLPAVKSDAEKAVEELGAEVTGEIDEQPILTPEQPPLGDDIPF